MRMLTTAAILSAGLGTAASAMIAGTSFDGSPLNQTSVSNSFDPNAGGLDFTSLGDGFKEYRDGDASMPFGLGDESNFGFPTDTQGIVTVNDNAGAGFLTFESFFGAIDTVNGDTTGPITATYVFDITSATIPVQLEISAAAMGDFEAADAFTIEASIDGGTPVVAFDFVADEDFVDQAYTLDSGTVELLNDPMTLQGINLDNDFATFLSPTIGSGSSLTVTITADLDGGSEAIALNSLNVVEVPEPASIALLAGAGAFAFGRRRR